MANVKGADPLPASGQCKVGIERENLSSADSGVAALGQGGWALGGTLLGDEQGVLELSPQFIVRSQKLQALLEAQYLQHAGVDAERDRWVALFDPLYSVFREIPAGT